MLRYRDIKRRGSGFSLIEIMVGVGIGLVATLVIMQVFTMFEGQKRTTTGGSDAQTNGGLALYTIERDLRMAGYGLGIPQALGCEVRSSFNSGPSTSFTLRPVTITKGVGGLPDGIRLLSSSKGSWSVPIRITSPRPPSADNFFVNTTTGLAVNDLMIAFEPGKFCSLLQVTLIPNGNVQFHHSSSSSPWDPPGGKNIFPQLPAAAPYTYTTEGYQAGALLFNLGALIDRTYSIDANYNLQVSDFSSATNTNNVQALIPNIVSLKAQYGYDNRPGAQSDDEVNDWEDADIDADGDGAAGDGGDIQRIFAVRMAVVARSASMEKATKADGSCDFYTGATPILKGPTWAGGAIDVSKNPNGTANPNWECYRYKVFETVIPLRNMLWSRP